MGIDINKEALKGHKDDINKSLGKFTNEVVSIDNYVDISGNFKLRDAHSKAKASRSKLTNTPSAIFLTTENSLRI